MQEADELSTKQQQQQQQQNNVQDLEQHEEPAPFLDEPILAHDDDDGEDDDDVDALVVPHPQEPEGDPHDVQDESKQAETEASIDQAAAEAVKQALDEATSQENEDGSHVVTAAAEAAVAAEVVAQDEAPPNHDPHHQGGDNNNHNNVMGFYNHQQQQQLLHHQNQLQHHQQPPYGPGPWVNPAFVPYWNTANNPTTGPPPPPPGQLGVQQQPPQQQQHGSPPQDQGPLPPPPHGAGGVVGWQGSPADQRQQQAMLYDQHGQQQHHHHHGQVAFPVPPGFNPHDFQQFLAWKEQQPQPPPPPLDLAASKKAGARKKKKKAVEMSAAAKSLLRLNNKEAAAAAAAAATAAANSTNPDGTPIELDTPWASHCRDSVLVLPGLRGDISDDLYLSMAQFVPCGLTQDDRVGKYKKREIGFVGLCCRHCGGQPGFGRYFPGSYDSFLNGTNCQGIVKHVRSECRVCPAPVRAALVQVERELAAAKLAKEAKASGPPARPRYGSRKRFFSYIWTKLREMELLVGDNNNAATGGKIGAYANKKDASKSENAASTTTTTEDAATTTTGGHYDSTENARMSLETIVNDSTIVDISDRHLVSDTTLVAMAQMKVCQVTQDDRIGRCKDHKLGFTGLCCKHCGGKAGKPGYGRYFPSSLRSLAQADSCSQIVKHITTKCTQVPDDIRSVVTEMHMLDPQHNGAQQDSTSNSAQQHRIKYGSRKIFFRRVWARLHGENAETAEQQQHNDASVVAAAVALENDDSPIPWDRVIGDSQVVSLSDQGLISDAQLAAIAQMDLCQLTESDRIGWFKSRDLGFGGLCCKHCGGRPSFGRYFPNSVRSFAQTTSSQTIISHVALYCQSCPQDIRDIVLRLQRNENSNQGTVTLSNSMYGSRKVFFDRVWGRMHQEDGVGRDGTKKGETPATPKATKRKRSDAVVVEPPEQQQQDTADIGTDVETAAAAEPLVEQQQQAESAPAAAVVTEADDTAAVEPTPKKSPERKTPERSSKRLKAEAAKSKTIEAESDTILQTVEL